MNQSNNDYLKKVYNVAIKNSKRSMDEQLKMTRTMIRVVLFLTIGALIYAAAVNLTISDIITIGVPVALIALVLQLFYAIERRTADVWDKIKKENS